MEQRSTKHNSFTGHRQLFSHYARKLAAAQKVLVRIIHEKRDDLIADRNLLIKFCVSRWKAQKTPKLASPKAKNLFRKFLWLIKTPVGSAKNFVFPRMKREKCSRNADVESHSIHFSLRVALGWCHRLDSVRQKCTPSCKFQSRPTPTRSRWQPSIELTFNDRLAATCELKNHRCWSKSSQPRLVDLLNAAQACADVENNAKNIV